MKNLTGILLALALLLSLGLGCYAEPVKAEPQAAEEQIRYFISNFSLFQQNGTQGKWYYTVTDLDHNGYLELLAVAADESNNSKSLRAWTVNPASSAVEPCNITFPEGMANPGLVVEKVQAYYNAAAEQWAYLFSTDLTLLATDVYTFRCSLSLQGMDLAYQVLPTEHVQMLEGYPVRSYLDSNGVMIAAEDPSSVPGEAQGDVNVRWVDSSTIMDFAAFSDSYQVFVGDKQPTAAAAAPAYQSAPAPAYQPVPTSSPTWTYVETPAPTLSQDATHDPMYDDIFASGSAPSWATPYPQPQSSWSTPYPEYQNPVPTPYLNRDPLYDGINNPSSSYYIPTPAPTQHIDLMVVRNPTDENRKPGSTANFVANANVRDSLTWSFVSPGGAVYSAYDFMSTFPNSPVSGLYEGVLSVSNVTEDMNGWGAFCTFYYEDQVATSGTGYIWIY